jgi:acetyl esterase
MSNSQLFSEQDQDRVAATRQTMLRRAAEGPAGAALPAVLNVLVPADDRTIPARLYLPRLGDLLPVLVWFHGGAFIAGDLDTTDAPCRSLAEAAGMAVLSVDYRLAPEHPFPAGLDDALDAVRFVLRDGASWGLDSGRVLVGGASAGGALAATVAQDLRAEPGLRAQVLVYPVLDCTPSGTSLDRQPADTLNRETFEFWMRLYVPDETQRDDQRASPGRGDLTDMPPCILVSGTLDPIRDDAEAFHRKLLDAGTDLVMIDVPDAGHGFFMPIGVGDEVIGQIGLELASRFGTVSSADRISAVRRFTETRDSAVRFQDFTPDFAWSIPGTTALSGRTVGFDALMRRAALFRSRLSSYESSVDVIHDFGEGVVRVGQSQGKTIDGRTFSGPQVLVFRFVGTRIADVTEFLDMDLIERVVYTNSEGAGALQRDRREESAQQTFAR